MTLIHTAQITTIDGFCAYVIRNYFHLIGLDPGYRTADEGELKLLQEDVLKELFEDHYAERKADFTAFVECYAPGKTDEGLKEHVLELYNAAMSNPWPEKWLDSCVENYHLDPEKGLEGTRWFRYLWEAADCALKEAEELTETAMKTCQLQDGPELYLEALEKDMMLIRQLKQLSVKRDYDEMAQNLRDLKFSRLSSKKMEGVSEQLKNLVKALREDAKDNLKELRIRYFYGNMAELTELTEASAPPLEMLVKLTKDFAERFQAKKREKNVLDFSDMEHFALEILMKKEGEDSVALNIAKGAVKIPEEKIQEIVFTMAKDKTKREACRQAAAEEIMKLLDEGKSIAMLALGDIGIYSTYAYVHKRLLKEGYDVEMVSGIPSFCAGASKAGISIVEGNEGFGVIPSLKGIDQVEKTLGVFDNLVIMKVGSHVKEVYELLVERGMENNALIISNVGMDGEYVGPLIPDREYGYFTTMIIKSEM